MFKKVIFSSLVAITATSAFAVEIPLSENPRQLSLDSTLHNNKNKFAISEVLRNFTERLVETDPRIKALRDQYQDVDKEHGFGIGNDYQFLEWETISSKDDMFLGKDLSTSESEKFYLVFQPLYDNIIPKTDTGGPRATELRIREQIVYKIRVKEKLIREKTAERSYRFDKQMLDLKFEKMFKVRADWIQ